MAMSLNQLTRANQPKPPRILIHGVAGVGKTTFASEANQPVFVQTEDGLGTLPSSHFPLARTYEDVIDALAALYTEPHDFKTVVIDSVDWLEPLVWGKACRDNGWASIEDAGYGKGYVAALNLWRQYIDGLNALRDDRGMTVVQIAHTDIKRFDSPEHDPYDRYVIKLHTRAADTHDGFRSHLGASLIGKECERALWYDFRWTTRSKHPGRLLRLFETGQLEEARLVRNLRRTGATVLEVDPETGRQIRVQAHGGHFGGSLDGAALNLIEAPKTWHVLEFKTHSNKSFGDLVAKKVQISKPQHFAQMQIYMILTGITRAMYLAVNKDTDDLHVERIEIDTAFAQKLLDKAQRIIFAMLPLARISDDPSWYQCRMCDHAPLCHGSADSAVAPEVNCRTCLRSTPMDGGWHCELHQRAINDSDQRTACERHLYLPQLVPGTQIDAGVDWVEYQFPAGQRWRDTGFNKHTNT